MPTIKMYGIQNCSSVKKAKTYFENHNISFDFIDFKKSTPELSSIENWLNLVGAELLVNKKGLTWRNHKTDLEKQIAQEGLESTLQKNLTLIKRPLVEWPNHEVTVGFDEANFQSEINLQSR